MYTLQSILGHTSLEMVRKYVHLATRKTVLTFPKFSPLDNIGKYKKRRATYLLRGVLFGEPSGIRTPDTLIKSQVLYRLS